MKISKKLFSLRRVAAFSIFIITGIVLVAGCGISDNKRNTEVRNHQLNYEIVATEVTDSLAEVTWRLPNGMNEVFSARLYSESDVMLTLDIENMKSTKENLQTAYYFPILITKKDEDLPFAQAEVFFRHIDNEDVVYYVSSTLLNGLEGTDMNGSDVQLVWEINESTQQNDSNELFYIVYGEVFNNVASKWYSLSISDYLDSDSTVQASVALPNASIFTDRIRFGMVDLFSKLENNVYVEHFDLSSASRIEVLEDTRQWIAKLPLLSKDYEPLVVEHWGVLSSDMLVQFDSIDLFDEKISVIDETINKSAQDIRIADLDRFRKMRHDGIYYEVPTSYTPYEPRAFWRVPAEHIGQRFIRSIREQEQDGTGPYGSYLETLAIVSMNHNVKQQTDGGFWITEPQSNWLYDDYGMEAGFYDTRFSTDAAMFLLDMYNYYKEDTNERSSTISAIELDEIFEAVTSYADFLLWFADTYSFTSVNGGLLVQDYFHPTAPHAPTHVSLNHLVTEMNFLLQFYQVLVKQSENNNALDDGVVPSNGYLNTAIKIRQAIHDTEEQWIKENNDLWYAYMPDGTYGLQDYPRLTRNDLRLGVELVNKVLLEDDEVFRRLIYFKEKYLRENGIPLW